MNRGDAATATWLFRGGELRLGTLPKLLGRRAARVTAAAALVGQHVSTCLLVRAGLLPPAVLLTLLCLPFETLAATKILLADKATKPAPTEKPSYDVEYRGSMLPFVPAKAFPLWFVAVAGWHAVVYGYWFCFGLAGAVLRKAWL